MLGEREIIDRGDSELLLSEPVRYLNILVQTRSRKLFPESDYGKWTVMLVFTLYIDS